MLALAHLAIHKQLVPTQLREVLNLSSGGLSIMVQRLERAGAITRHQNPNDARSKILTATPEILAQIAEQTASLRHALDAVGARFSSGDRLIIASYLEEVARLVDEQAQAAVSSTRRGPPDQPTQSPVPPLWA
jgi:DNA-binding MarR family transcriptional regulator